MRTPKTYVKTDGCENIYNSMLKNICYSKTLIIELWYGISNNVVCATSKASDQPVHMHSLIKAFASPLNILQV